MASPFYMRQERREAKMQKEFQIQEEMVQDEQGRSIPIVSIAIDGDLKELLGVIAKMQPVYGSYSHLIGAALGEGLAVLLAEAKRAAH